MWEFVDKVVYINLNKRGDRNKKMQKVLAMFGDKVIRLSAIETTPGYIGCLQSHIAVLTNANGWRNVLIMEDDVEWNNFEAGYKIVEKLAMNPYDVIHFGPSAVTMGPDYRLLSGQAASSYLVNGPYINVLLNCYKTALPHLIQTNNEATYGADQCWKPLMLSDRWYAPLPVLMYQRPDYSDIRGYFQDHRHYFNRACALAD